LLELWLRLLVVLRMLLENLGTMVLPNQKAIAKVNTLMEDGAITDEKTIKQLKNLGNKDWPPCNCSIYTWLVFG